MLSYRSMFTEGITKPILYSIYRYSSGTTTLPLETSVQTLSSNYNYIIYNYNIIFIIIKL